MGLESGDGYCELQTPLVLMLTSQQPMESGEEEIWYSKFVYKKVWNLDMDHIEAGKHASKKALAKTHS